MVNFSSIQDAAILAGLDQSELEQLAAIAGEQGISEGEQLFVRGEPADTFYIVKRGCVALTLAVRAFGELDEFVVEEKRALDAFGWSCLVAPKTSIYSAYCVSDGAVVTIPGDDLQRLFEDNRKLGERVSWNLNELIGERVRNLQSMWIGELENSGAKVDYWTHTTMSNRLRSAIKKRQSTISAA